MREFDRPLTLVDSAQVFHWRKTPDGYAALVNGQIMTDSDDSDEARFYFDDARDYSLLTRNLGAYPKAMEAVLALPGLRVLNQPAWEALVAFILSANNNVKRIRGLVEAVCSAYGTRTDFRGVALCGFPTPERLARVDEAEMRERTRCGYRAGYLIRAARIVAEGFDLEALRRADTEDARRALMTLPGVGGKVADCVLLFGLGHASAFPVDVWVDRLMRDWFGVSGSRERMRREAPRLLGPECGLIQQSLFHAARTGLIGLEKTEKKEAAV